MGADGLSLRDGQEAVCRFVLDLHLVGETYYVAATVRRYDIGKNLDERRAAQAIIVSSEKGNNGIANLYPVVTIEYSP